MITKERLEELIKERASVYWRDGRKIKPSLWNKYSLWEHAIVKNNLAYIYDYVDLFETKEDLDFHNKYQNIPRTETLSLPTFEEIIKEIGMNGTYNIEFTSKNEWDECTLSVCTARQYIIVEGYKHWDLTKANYLEACELCRKLFLGEEE